MSVRVKTPTRTRLNSSVSAYSRDTQHRHNEGKGVGRPQCMKRRRYLQQFRQDVPNQQFLKRKRADQILLPTKFLLGGNINDPLNLNALCHTEIGRQLNETTPVSSPMPLPAHRQSVEVVRPNTRDPLNLNGDADEDVLGMNSYKKRKRHRTKKRDSVPSTETGKERSSSAGDKQDLRQTLRIDVKEPSEDIQTERPRNANNNSGRMVDKIVSPVIPQVLRPKKRRRAISECGTESTGDTAYFSHRRSSSPELCRLTPPKKIKRQTSNNKQAAGPSPVKFKQDVKFVYGNYNRYYGYRNPDCASDHRLESFGPHWFEGKDVLDIGCNVGHLTLAIARDFHPRKVIGMDIDGNLIKVARKNIRHYLSLDYTESNDFPLSSTVTLGPVAAPPVGSCQGFPPFPKNVLFIQGNYVLERDELLELQREEYDVILALSITKWIHLNWGDAGLKRFFKRIFRQLRPGGRLILEPQPWPSYKKRKKLTETIFHNYQQIQLRPDQFRNYLLSRDVGFSKCEAIEQPYHPSKGFQRPLQLYTKADTCSGSPNSECSRSYSPALHRNRGEVEAQAKSRLDMPLSASPAMHAHTVSTVSPVHACPSDSTGVVRSPRSPQTEGD